MNYLKFLNAKNAIIIVFLLFVSCNYNDEKDNYLNKDSVNGLILNENFISYNNFSYLEERDYFLSEYQEIYDYIAKTEVNDSTLLYLSNNYSSYFLIVGMFHNESLVLQIPILYYLKLYRKNLEGDKYGYNISCCITDNEFSQIFYIIFTKVSYVEPGDFLFTNNVFDWVSNDNSFDKSVDIEKEISIIDSLHKLGYTIY